MPIKEEILDIDFEAAMEGPGVIVKLEQPQQGIVDSLPRIHRGRYSHSLESQQIAMPRTGSSAFDDELNETNLMKYESVSVHLKEEAVISGIEAMIGYSKYHLASGLREMESKKEKEESPAKLQKVATQRLLGIQDTMNFKHIEVPRDTAISELDQKQQQKSRDKTRLSHKICRKQRGGISEYDRYKKLHDVKKAHHCKRCGKKFENKICLAKHSSSCACKRTYWSCEACDKTFISEHRLRIHFKNHQNNQIFTCDVCARSYTRKGSLVIHMKSHFSSQSFQCQICRKSFPGRYAFTRHMHTHSKEKIFWCDDCGKGFTNKGNMKSHARSHMRDFACNICDRRFNHNHHLKLHLLSHTGEKPFSCADCSKKFKTKQQLISHCATHCGKIPFLCKFCNKAFKLRKTLEVHIVWHTYGKQFACETCDKSFQNRSTLKKHMEKFHPRENHSRNFRYMTYSDENNLVACPKGYTTEVFPECEVCGLVCRSKYILKIHTKIHESEKVSCNICGVSFRNKDLLDNHKDSHKNEKRPCVCNVCGCQYIERRDLKRQIMIHTGERPIGCAICGKRWKTKRDLIKHLKSHSNVRPFSCEFCNAKFKERYKLTRHMRARHPQKLSTESASSSKNSCDSCSYCGSRCLNYHKR